MLMTANYEGVVENGVIRLRGATLPEGTKVVVVYSRDLSVEEQLARLNAMSLEERQRAFDQFTEFARQHPAEADIDKLSDEELDAIVHEVRSERMGLK